MRVFPNRKMYRHSVYLYSYLLSMHTAKDVEDYLSELLGADHPGGLVFQKEFISRWHPPQRVPSPLTPQEGKILEELTRPPQEDMVLFRGDGSRGTVSKTSKKVCLLWSDSGSCMDH